MQTETTGIKTNEWNTLELGVRTMNALANTNLQTIGDLTAMTAAELRTYKGLGPSAVDDIVYALGDKGLALRE